MSYVTGKGKINFNASDEDKEKIFGLIEDNIGEAYDGGNYIEFWMDGEYFEDDVKKALQNIAEIAEISSGELDITYEDDEFWRFIYRDGVWQKQDGHVVYDDPDVLVTSVTWPRDIIGAYLRACPWIYPQGEDFEEFLDDVMHRCRCDHGAFSSALADPSMNVIMGKAIKAAEERKERSKGDV